MTRRSAPVRLLAAADIRPAGLHNVTNALSAAALALAAGVPPSAGGHRTAANFRPGEHRNVEVAVRQGVRYVNDSKATNPHAAAASLAGYDRVVWIAGGQLKGRASTIWLRPWRIGWPGWC